MYVAEVIRSREPAQGGRIVGEYNEWDEITFTDDDAWEDYQCAANVYTYISGGHDYIFNREVKGARDYVSEKYNCEPGLVNVNIHSPLAGENGMFIAGTGTIHLPPGFNSYAMRTVWHEYGHFVHCEELGVVDYLLVDNGLTEGWATYFGDYLSALANDGDAGRLETNIDHCQAGQDLDDEHKWGYVHAGIFRDLCDAMDANDTDDFDGPNQDGEKRIWNTLMKKKVKNMDQFYNGLVDNNEERDALNTIYATHGLISPIYEGELNLIDVPELFSVVRKGDKLHYDVKVTNTGDDWPLDYEIQFMVSPSFDLEQTISDMRVTGELEDVPPGQQTENSISWDWSALLPVGLYDTMVALTPEHYNNIYYYDDEIRLCRGRYVDYDLRNVMILDEGAIGILSDCPVDVTVVDPEGLVINKESNEILGATYVETDINGDGDLDDIILIPDRKIGDYQITVTPEPDAEPNDTYTLVVSAGDTTIVLAEDVPISEIPDQPYIIRSAGEGIFQIIPATVRIEPETLNLASKGVFTAFIQLPEGYDVANINISTVECEGAPAIEGKIVHGGEGGHHGKGHGGDTLEVKFKREDLVDVSTGDAVTLTVIGKVLAQR